MPQLEQRMILYHGSYCEVQEPDISRCERYKDFGQGFYLTSSREQAKSFARITTHRAIDNKTIKKQGYGIISTFEFLYVDGLNVLDYPTANIEWLHCIVGHRKKNYFPELVAKLKEYDIISGKIANDNTNATINAYLQEVFGAVGSKEADEICIGLLLPERLQDQFCFRSTNAIQTLTFKRSEMVWL